MWIQDLRQVSYKYKEAFGKKNHGKAFKKLEKREEEKKQQERENEKTRKSKSPAPFPRTLNHACWGQSLMTKPLHVTEYLLVQLTFLTALFLLMSLKILSKN